MQRAFDRAGRAAEGARRRPPKRKASSSEEKSLQEKLYDMFVEERGKQPETAEELTRSAHLLEKLARRESLPRLLVNLLPGEKQYSLVLLVETKVYSEMVLLPYEERDFLEYLDAEELPPDLVEVLDKSQVNIFQGGCVVAEVRDYRLCTNSDCSGFQSRHVLLRPTMRTLASDVHSVTGDDQVPAQEDRLSLESQPILAPAEPLRLDPSGSAACIEDKLLCDWEEMNAPPMEGSLQDDPAASPNPQPQVWSPPPPELGAWAPDQRNEEGQADHLDDLNMFIEENIVDVWERLPFGLHSPSDFEKYAAEDWPFNYDDAHSIVWPALEEQDDSPCECQAGTLSPTTKPTVMQSLNDPFISGQGPREKVRCGRRKSHLPSYISDHSYSCLSGAKAAAGKTARQSKKPVKKRDRRRVRVPQGSRVSASLSQPCPGTAAEQPQAVSTPSAALGHGGQRTPPALSLPCSSGKGDSGKPLPPQQPIMVPALSLPCSSGEGASGKPLPPQQPIMVPALSLPCSSGEGASGKPLPPQQPIMVPALSLPCRSGKGDSGKPLPPQQPIMVRVLPSPAPACQPPRPPKKPSVEVKRARARPAAAAVSSASASHVTPFIQLKDTAADPKVVQLIGPVRIVRTVVREHDPAQASPRGARAPAGARPGRQPPRGQPQKPGPAAPRAASQGGEQYVLGHLSSLRPIRVLWVPQGSDVAAALQQAQQPQQLLCHLVTQPPPAPPPAPRRPQAVVRVSRARGAGRPPKGPPAQQVAVIEVTRVRSAPQPQPGSVQTGPGHSPAPQPVQLPSASQQLPQSWVVQGQVVLLSEAVGAASVQPAQPDGGQQPAGQAQGTGKGGLPGAPGC